jgi:Flp pilus assembly protein TadG
MTDEFTPKNERSTTAQRGQAIVLIAMGFIMLLAFTGLVVDVARVFAIRGDLRRAVDAAGLAATAQFRQGASGTKVTRAAYNLVATHGIPSPNVVVETCDLGDTVHNPGLCRPNQSVPSRKLVRVVATAQVPMLFLQLVGIPTVSVAGENTSEAASVDAVLVLDNSESQSYDFSTLPAPYNTKCNQTLINDIYACLNGGTLADGTHVDGCNNEPITDPAHLAAYPDLTRGICQPFLKTKEAAVSFIRRLYQGYDRVAIINLNETGQRTVPMTEYLYDGVGSAVDRINNMDVFVSPPYVAPNGHIACNSATPASEAWKCASSNIGAGLIMAHDEFALAVPYRADSLWVTILLVDGAANRTSPDDRVSWSDAIYGLCPTSEQSTPLKCRDYFANTRHYARPVVSTIYDADDYARDWGDILASDPEKYPNLTINTSTGEHDATGVLVYTIALGKNSVCSNGAYTPPLNGAPAVCTGSNPVYGDPDAAEQLLRYIADVGDDGDLSTGPCLGPKNADPAQGLISPWGTLVSPQDFAGRSNRLGLQCGNYYFAPAGDQLEQIFLEIAGRIFTRISG